MASPDLAAGLSPWGITLGAVVALPVCAVVVLGSLLAGQSFGVCMSSGNPSKAAPFKLAAALMFMGSLGAAPTVAMGGHSGFLPAVVLGFSGVTLGLGALALACIASALALRR